VAYLEAVDALGLSDPYAWAVAGAFRTERGLPMDWESHRFLIGPLRDNAAQIVVRKAAQVGFTTAFHLKALHAVAIRGWNGIYTFPTDGLLQDKVKETCNGLLRQNPALAALSAGGEDSLHAKRLGGGAWLWYVATETERAAISRPADFVCHDEYDRGNLQNAETFDSRLGHSPHRRKWRFSNPTIPGVAEAPTPNIDGLWLASDQKHWFNRCPCGGGPHDGRQFLDWPESVDVKREVFACRWCGREMDRTEGFWWPRYPGRPVSGYWLPQLAAPWIDAPTIIAESAKDPTYFWNFVLGKPYRGGLEVPWDEIIDRGLRPSIPERDNIVFGVDQGQSNGHWIIAGSPKRGLQLAANVPHWSDIDALVALWRPRVACVDVDPEREAVRGLTERLRRLGCRVIPVDYTDSPRRDLRLDYLDDKATPVQAFRTQTIDAFALGPFASSAYPIRLSGKSLEMFRNHWRAMTPVYEPDHRGNPVRRWIRSGPDHLAHATILWWLAATRFGGGKAEIRVPKEEF
jgi:hypothetical protein